MVFERPLSFLIRTKQATKNRGFLLAVVPKSFQMSRVCICDFFFFKSLYLSVLWQENVSFRSRAQESVKGPVE